jgi:hypothetical protein
MADFEVGGWLVWYKAINTWENCVYPITRIDIQFGKMFLTWLGHEYPYTFTEIDESDNIVYVGPNDDLEKKVLFWKLKYPDDFS